MQRLGNLPENVIYFQNIANSPTHDVAVDDVTSHKTIINQGYSNEIVVTVANQGTFSETFSVTAYTDTKEISLSKSSA